MPLGAARLNFLSKSITVEAGEDTSDRTAVTVTANGGTNVSTTQSKFGGASAFFDGDFDGITMDPLDWAGRDTVTVECWVYWTDNTNTFSFIWSSRLLGNVLPAGETQLLVYNTGKIGFYVGSSQILIETATGALSLNTWTHIAVTKNNNTWELWVDGTSQGTDTSAQAITVDKIMMGQVFAGSNTFTAYDGYIDEFRVSHGVRYTSSFTPPTSAFTNDANTLCLVHCDGANNSTTFSDDNS